MANLPEFRDQAVNLDIYSLQDRQFKKPVTKTTVQLVLENNPALLLKQISVRGSAFKVNHRDPKDENGARLEFLQTLNDLNTALTFLSTREFVINVFKEIERHLNQICESVRDDKSYPIHAYQYKSIMKDAIESTLINGGLNPQFNIGNGTLYLNEKVIVNSGVTSSTSLSNGLFSFLKFIPQGYSYRQYKMLREKLIGAFEEGAWLNKDGDTPLKLAYRIMVLSAFESFLLAMIQYLSINLDKDPVLNTIVESTSENLDLLQKELDKLIDQKAIEHADLLAIPLVANSEGLQQINELSLGNVAISAFCEQEAKNILLKEITRLIGADSFYIINPYEVAESEDRYGHSDEFYNPHISLPNRKVREGMLAFKALLELDDSLVSMCFDRQHMQLNVSGTCDYDPNTNDTYSEREFLNINSGISAQIADREEIVRFTFKLRGN